MIPSGFVKTHPQDLVALSAKNKKYIEQLYETEVVQV